MTVLYFVLMGYHFTGRTIHEYLGFLIFVTIHEYLGFLIFVFFILHNIMNINWYKNLPKGKYNFNRSLNTFINVMLFICMFGLVVSGILFNRDLVEFLNLSSIKVFNKKLHIVCSYWGFILMSVHLGMHWGIFINMSKKIIKKQIYILIGFIIAVYGIVSFIKRGFYINMFVIAKVPKAEEAAVFFFMDHVAVMGVFIFITYYLHRLSNKLNKMNIQQG